MKKDSTTGKLAKSVLVLPGSDKEENDREAVVFSQPMGSACLHFDKLNYPPSL